MRCSSNALSSSWGADGDDIQVRHPLAQAGQEAVEELPAGRGRIGSIKNIPGNQQAIDVALQDQIRQPVEKTALFIASIVAMQMMAEMPVCGV